MVKPSKRTKNFTKKHLGAALKQRTKVKPLKNAQRRKAAAFRQRGEEEAPDGEEVAEQKQSRGVVSTRGEQGHPSEVSQHKEQLKTLKDKDPEFYEFLQEHDEKLLDFSDEDDEVEEGDEEVAGAEEEEDEEEGAGPSKPEGTQVTLSAALINEWCAAVREKRHVGAVRNILQAYRTACHYGDGDGDNLTTRYNITSSHVFNKIMVFVLSEMDGTLKGMLGLTGSEKVGRHQGTAAGLQENKKWKKVEPFVKTYLGNSFHVLHQMTDTDMITFTLRRLKVSVPFMAAFPKLAHKFLKVALHFWGSGDGAVPIMALFLIREMALQLDKDMLDTILKGIYKAYAVNAKFVNAATVPQIEFRASCVVELSGIDLGVTYQLAFVFIRQLATVLRNAISMKTKDAVKKVYCWQYMNSLHLWVKVICMYAGQDELRPLLYPLVQTVGGVAQLLPTVQYFPLRLKCSKMLNEMALATSAFTPVASYLLDMLQFKELFMPPTEGLGKAIDFDATLKVPKVVVKTKAFQEQCVAGVLEQLGEHLGLWSCSISFPELAVIPLLNLRQFLKKTNVDQFRRQVKQLVEQIESNVQFVWRKRVKVNFSPRDTKAVLAFLEEEKKAGSSPLSQYVVTLQSRAKQRSSNLHKTSDSVGDGTHRGSPNGRGMAEEDEDDSGDGVEGDEEDGGDDDQVSAEVFSKDWLAERPSKEKRKGRKRENGEEERHEDESDDDEVPAKVSSKDRLAGKPSKEKRKERKPRLRSRENRDEGMLEDGSDDDQVSAKALRKDRLAEKPSEEKRKEKKKRLRSREN